MTGDAMGAAFIASIVATLGGLLVWFLFRRPIEETIKKAADLETKLADLQDNRVAKIEANFDCCRRDEGGKRKEIYLRIEAIEQQAFTVKHLCSELEKLAGRIEGLLIDVSKAGEELAQTVKTVDRISDKQVALGEDLARIQGARDNGGRRAL